MEQVSPGPDISGVGRHDAAAGSRRYRSKAQRPCDTCRARKALCNIPDPTQPCQLCLRLGRECTFVSKAGRRPPRRTAGRQSASKSPSEGGVLDARTEHPAFPDGDVEGDHLPQSQNMSLNLQSSDLLWPPADNFSWGLSDDELIRQTLQGQRTPSPLPLLNLESNMIEMEGIHESARSFQPANTPAQFSNAGGTRKEKNPTIVSLSSRPSHSTTLIGYSNESDPFALNSFPYDEDGEVDFFRVTYRKIGRSDGPSGPRYPLHFLHSQNGTATESRKIVDECLPDLDDRARLDRLVDINNGTALVRLFLRFVFPSLPILSRSLVLQDVETFVKEGPTGLLAGIYALSLPFAAWDESLCLHNAYSPPNVTDLWKITHTSLQRQLQFPSLVTVQTYLVLLNYLPFDPVSVENPFAWSMASAMLAMAQSLGLNADPSGWNLPAWEIRLRRRLWWAVVVEHTWRAITHGRSSMLREDDWDVSELSDDDFVLDAEAHKQSSQGSPAYFINLCSLTLIADQICRQFFTLRAVSRQQSLETLVSQARGLRQRLLDWWEHLPDELQLNFDKSNVSEDEDLVESHAPLYVAYFASQILLFRALLRPIIKGGSAEGVKDATIASVLQASRSLIRTIMKFLCGVDARQQSAFWPAYTRHCLSFPGLFCYMVSLQRSELDMASHDHSLLATWRKILRTRVQSWPLLRFAIVKVDAIYWKGIQQSRGADLGT